MKLHLRAHLVDVRTMHSQRGRDLVVLEWIATGQPDLPPLLDLYVVDHPLGSTFLRVTAEALGYALTEHGSAEEYATALEGGRRYWREVVLVTSVVEWRDTSRLVIQRVTKVQP